MGGVLKRCISICCIYDHVKFPANFHYCIVIALSGCTGLFFFFGGGFLAVSNYVYTGLHVVMARQLLLKQLKFFWLCSTSNIIMLVMVTLSLSPSFTSFFWPGKSTFLFVCFHWNHFLYFQWQTTQIKNLSDLGILLSMYQKAPTFLNLLLIILALDFDTNIFLLKFSVNHFTKWKLGSLLYLS